MKPLIALGTLAFAGASVLPASSATLGHMRRLDTTTGLTGFVATSTKAFKSGIVLDMGAAATTTPVRLTIPLVTRNPGMINALLSRQNTPGDSLYHVALTEAQTEALFSPSAAQVQAVETYLTSKGFTGVTATPDRELVLATGTVATANAAFNVGEHAGVYAGKPVLINTLPALVPTALGGIVRSVIGVNTVPLSTFQRKRQAGATCVLNPVNNVCTLNDFTPRGFWRVYDASGPHNGGSLNPSYNSGANTEIAIFTEGVLTQVVKDLRIQEHLYSLPQAQYQIIQQPGFNSTDTSGADEWDIDTQSSSGIAGYVKKLDIFDANSLTDADLMVSYDQFKTLNTAKAVSASFGECDFLETLSGAQVPTDQIFAEAALHGQTAFASSGDSGTGCLSAANGVPAGVPGAEYPGSSTYVISVGGTSLFATPDNFYQGEITWFSGGGNVSSVETAGPWTTTVATPYATAGTRAVPDIAMDADPNVSGGDVTVAGVSNIYGGTSLASPLALGVWARIETQHNNGIGFAGPPFYKEFGDDNNVLGITPGYFTHTVGGFNDVLVGENGAPASPGYDLGTGIGSLDIALQIKHIGD